MVLVPAPLTSIRFDVTVVLRGDTTLNRTILAVIKRMTEAVSSEELPQELTNLYDWWMDLRHSDKEKAPDWFVDFMDTVEIEGNIDDEVKPNVIRYILSTQERSPETIPEVTGNRPDLPTSRVMCLLSFGSSVQQDKDARSVTDRPNGGTE